MQSDPINNPSNPPPANPEQTEPTKEEADWTGWQVAKMFGWGVASIVAGVGTVGLGALTVVAMPLAAPIVVAVGLAGAGFAAYKVWDTGWGNTAKKTHDTAMQNETFRRGSVSSYEDKGFHATTSANFFDSNDGEDKIKSPDDIAQTDDPPIVGVIYRSESTGSEPESIGSVSALAPEVSEEQVRELIPLISQRMAGIKSSKGEQVYSEIKVGNPEKVERADGELAYSFSLTYKTGGEVKTGKAVVTMTRFNDEPVALMEFRETSPPGRIIPPTLAPAPTKARSFFGRKPSQNASVPSSIQDYKKLLAEDRLEENSQLDEAFSQGRVSEATYLYKGKGPHVLNYWRGIHAKNKSGDMTHVCRGKTYTVSKQFGERDATRDLCRLEGFPLSSIGVFKIQSGSEGGVFSEKTDLSVVDRYILALEGRGLTQPDIETLTYFYNQSIFGDFLFKGTVLYQAMPGIGKIDKAGIDTTDSQFANLTFDGHRPVIELIADYKIYLRSKSRGKRGLAEVPGEAFGRVVLAVNPLNSNPDATDGSLTFTETSRPRGKKGSRPR